MHGARIALAAVLVGLFGLLIPAGAARAQSLTAQNDATVTVHKELDVTGDLSASGGGALAFASAAALTLSGSSQQTVAGSVGPVTVADLKLDNENGAALNSAVDVTSTLRLTSGSLTTNGNLTLTSTSETSTAAIAGSGGGSVNGDVTFERRLAKSDDASHFRMLGAPTTTALDDEASGANARNLLSNMWTQSVGSGADAQVSDPANASVYAYDEGADLNDSNPDLSSAWSDVQDLDGSVGPGEGYLVYLFADRDPPQEDGAEGFPATLRATGAVQAEENNGSAIAPTITFTGGDGDDTSNNGWNLIANPFMAPIDWEQVESDGSGLTNVTREIYVYDAANGGYAIYQADGSGTNGTKSGTGTQGRYVAPFQAFFVKATGSSPSIGGIDAGDKALGQNPSVKSAPGGSPQVTLRLRAERAADDSTGEKTVLRFVDGAAEGKGGGDAYQLEPLSGSYAFVASEMAGTESIFDIQARPMPAEVDTIGLALDLTESGTYALGAGALENLPSDWNVVLENTESGRRWDLEAGETATFDHTAPSSSTRSRASATATPLQGGAPTVATVSSSGQEPDFRLFVGPSAALPVELASFEARAEGTKVTLRWQTTLETENAGFAIERKVEGGTWSPVGFREGAGTTDQPQAYRFTDADVPFEAERVRYRLRQRDLDGSTTLSQEVTAQLGAPPKTRLHAPFPNPARQRATLRYEVPSRPSASAVRIALHDVLGRRVRTIVSRSVEAGRHERRVDLRGLPAGTYFLRLQAGETTQTRRLTIVR